MNRNKKRITKVVFTLCITLSCTTTLLLSCNQKKKCLDYIDTVKYSLRKDKNQYDSIAVIFKSVEYSVDKQHPQRIHDSLLLNNFAYKRLVTKFSISTITIPEQEEAGQLSISILTEKCDYVFSDINLIYATDKLQCTKNSKVVFDSIAPNWYIETISQ